MTTLERKRLVGILGRLASDYDGERAAAGLLAARMLRSAGLTWEQVIPESSVSRRRQTACHWRTDLGVCQRHFSFLRPWEQGFVANVSALGMISPNHRTTLAEIAGALRERGRA